MNDLSQEEVASKLSIPLSYIQELEFGSKKPSKEILSEYAKFFVIVESELENFDRDNKNKSTKDYLYDLISAVNEREDYLRVMVPASTIGEYSNDNRRSIKIKYSHGGEGELYGAIPSCEHEIIPRRSGGVYCSKCGGWFCY